MQATIRSYRLALTDRLGTVSQTSDCLAEWIPTGLFPTLPTETHASLLFGLPLPQQVDSNGGHGKCRTGSWKMIHGCTEILFSNCNIYWSSKQTKAEKCFSEQQGCRKRCNRLNLKDVTPERRTLGQEELMVL